MKKFLLALDKKCFAHRICNMPHHHKFVSSKQRFPDVELLEIVFKI